MIHIIELPDQQAPRAWFAFDAEDLLAKTAVALGRDPWSIWDRTSVRELIGADDDVRLSPDTLAAQGHSSALIALGREQGWDTPLYRADDLLGPGALQTAPVAPLAACAAALQAAGTQRHIYPDDSAAMAAFERGDAEFPDHGWRARWALRQQLIEMEVLADDC